MKPIKYMRIWTVSLLAVITACTGMYDQYNTNPNQITDEDRELDYLNSGRSMIPRMQMHIFTVGYDANPYQRMQNLVGDIYSGYLAGTGVWNSNYNGCTYSLLDDWNKVHFEQTFTMVMPTWREIKKSDEQGNPATYAVAQILKVMAVHRCTDIYGPLPYLEFGRGGQSTPYDSQQAIYDSFFVDLDAAIKVLVEFVEKYPGSKTLVKFDMVYGGDFVKWIRFANSLKLRLAMRIVYIDPGAAQRYAEEAVSHAYGVIADNADNAALRPIEGTVFSHPLKQIWDNYGDTRMGAMMESMLTGYADPRLPHYFKTAAYTGAGKRDYMGVRNGIQMTSTYQSVYRTFSIPNVDADTPLQWMCAAELYFLRAEGALRGWEMGGTAEELYNRGVTTSFEQYGVQAAAAGYLANSTDKAAPYLDACNPSNNIAQGNSLLPAITVKWDGSAGFEANLERIITQKWLCMFPDGQEAWSEFRRTGYPRVFPNQLNYSSSQISTTIQIRRLKYPLDEYSKNPQGVNGALNNPEKLDGPDTGGTKLWWDKKS